MTLPDKHVRKAFYDRIHNMDVSEKTIPCYDSRATNYHGDAYVILGLQTNVQQHDKCKGSWRSTILIEVFTRNFKNAASRVFADDIVQEIFDLTQDLNLLPASNLSMGSISISTPNDIVSDTDSELVHRKFIRYETIIKQL